MVDHNLLNFDQLERYLQYAVYAALCAGKKIIKHYVKGDGTHFKIKSDGSPVTLADEISHKSIVSSLMPLGIPLVSEEDFGKSAISGNSLYWLVDPLDGTKDFLAKNDEFTVNIALVQNQRPILGVVYAPALNELYRGSIFKRAIKVIGDIAVESPVLSKSSSPKMAISRFHPSKESEIFAAKNGISNLVEVGASLKYVRIAFGDIDVYPRMVGTSEWDTAAGQAILESVGGNMIDLKTKMPIVCGKENRRNGEFLAFRAPYQLSDFII